MFVLRFVAALGVATMGLAAATPASAQFFLRSHDFTGAPVTGSESDLVVSFPGATASEQRAALVWNMRAAAVSVVAPSPAAWALRA